MQVAGLDLNDHKGSTNLCSSNANGQARYIPPHLRGGESGPADGSDGQNGGNRNYRENNYRDQGGYRNDQGGYRNDQGYRNDNR